MISKVTVCVVSSLLFSCALVNGEVKNATELSKRWFGSCPSQGSSGIPWANKFDEPVNFQCPRGGAITSIYSEYSACRRDRVWRFGCKNVVSGGFIIRCRWRRDFVNDWDKPLFGYCGPNAYLSGMYSVHDNSKEDRRFKIRCCWAFPKKGLIRRRRRYVTMSCCPPLKFKSAPTYQKLIDFKVKERPGCRGDIISGLQSTHDNHKEDRLWRVTVCRFRQCR